MLLRYQGRPTADTWATTLKPWPSSKEDLYNLFVAAHDSPVFSILLDTEVVSFLWFIDLRLHDVAMAESVEDSTCSSLCAQSAKKRKAEKEAT